MGKEEVFDRDQLPTQDEATEPDVDESEGFETVVPEEMREEEDNGES